MKTRIVPTNIIGITMYEIHHRRWWWPFWTLNVTTTSLRDAQAIAQDIRNDFISPLIPTSTTPP